MKIQLILIGKTNEKYLIEGFSIFEKRIKNYIDFKTIIIPELKNTKNLSFELIKKQESELLMKHIQDIDFVVLLDENGKNSSSIEFSKFINSQMIKSTKNLVFVIGGAYGFSENVYNRANDKIALSRMTFSHQMVRIIFAEQLYRAFTILNNEPYHHI